MHNYSNFLGETYTKLIARADFAALITGNVPSKIDGYDEEFCIQTYKKGLEFQFSSAERSTFKPYHCLRSCLFCRKLEGSSG